MVEIVFDVSGLSVCVEQQVEQADVDREGHDADHAELQQLPHQVAQAVMHPLEACYDGGCHLASVREAQDRGGAAAARMARGPVQAWHH